MSEWTAYTDRSLRFFAMAQEHFSEQILQELNGPLSQHVVKSRSQSGRTLAYIEGWWAISEANRIFGFGSWDQKVIDIKCVVETPRKIGRDKKDGWGVSYIARVCVDVRGVIREGVGSGHGIDVDLGLAHESAIKEAATDALKRALMTFGNKFGLALYDKSQQNVADAPPNLEPVSETEKANSRFIQILLEKMEQCGIDSRGIQTLKAILKVADFEEVREVIRDKLIANLTPEYAQKLNAGQNGKGEQVIEFAEAKIQENIAKLSDAAASAFN